MSDNNDKFKLEIPRLFYDSISNMPIAKCQVCEKRILETDTEYIIEKVYRKSLVSGKMEVMFEYAICFGCAMTMMSNYSAQSKEPAALLFRAFGRKFHSILS